MNVSLTDELEGFVTEQVASGAYASQSEVVRAGLRLLIERERLLEAQVARAPRETEPEAAVAAERGVTSLPPELWVHFPEYRGSGLSLESDRDAVIERLVQVDDLRAAQWLRERVPTKELRRYVTGAGAAALDPGPRRLWTVLLDLPATSPGV